MIGHSVIRPRRKLKLANFALLGNAILHPHQLQRILRNGVSGVANRTDCFPGLGTFLGEGGGECE